MVNPLAPWRRPGRLFRAAAHVAIGLPVAIITFVVIVVMTALSIGLMPVFLLGIPILWLTLMVSRGLARLERSRAGAFRRTIADSVPPLTRTSWLGRLGERLRSKARWREIAHHLLQLPVCVISYALVAAAWCGSLAMALLPAYVGTFPGDSAKFYFFEIDATDPTRWLAMAVGVVGILFVAPWVTIGAASVAVGARRSAARADRGRAPRRAGDRPAVAPDGGRRLGRVGAAADRARPPRRRPAAPRRPRRRRWARRATSSTDDPEAGRELVAAAHEEAKAALSEIRDLVRGIHPVILEDRGIDAALSAVDRPLARPRRARRADRRAATGRRRERRLLRRHRGAHQRRPPQRRDARQRLDRPVGRPARRRDPRQRPRWRRCVEGNRPARTA